MGNFTSGMNKNTVGPVHKPKITSLRASNLTDFNHKEWVGRLKVRSHRPLDAHRKPRHPETPEMQGNPQSGDALELPRKVVPKIIELSDDEDDHNKGIPGPRCSLDIREKPILKHSGNAHSIPKRRKSMRNPNVDEEEGVEVHQQPGGRGLPKPQIPAHVPGLPRNPFANGPPLDQRFPSPGLGRAPSWQDFDDEGVFDEELVRAMMMDDFAELPATQSAPSPAGLLNFLEHQDHLQHAQPEVVMESRVDCIYQVLAVFPGICQDYVSELFVNIAQSSDRLIAHILDKMEKGSSYPKAKDVQKTLKRKRELDEDEEAARKYGSADRIVDTSIHGTRPYVRNILSYEFPETSMSFIDAALAQAKFRLFVAYRVLEEAHRTYDPARPVYNKIKNARKMPVELQEQNFQATIESSSSDPDKVEVLHELQACRRIKKKEDLKRQEEREAELEEERNIIRAEQEGSMAECACCFVDHPINRMVHCNSDEVMHWFCRGCASRNAETEIGNSKYVLRCMSMDGCEGGFNLDQRSQFLDEKTTVALERNEQEAVLRMAGIENLASCPFCPFAAEYPPVEVDREFRCQAPDCEKVSCRLCKLESHIPRSCEESAKENGLSIRRQIEEAMSAALIRTCNKCNTPFVKEEGCNKMTCTRNGCFNVQCYICSKSCGYDHFNDSRRGGKSGNCPLFEDIEQRHNSEVQKAEKEALEKVRAEHPEYTEEDLKITMSENVKKDDKRRKGPRAQAVHAAHARIRPLPYVHRIPDLPAFDDFYPDAEDEQEFLALFGNLPLPPRPAVPAAPRLRPIQLPQHLPAWRLPRAPDIPSPNFLPPRPAPQVRRIAHEPVNEQINGQVNDADRARGYVPRHLRNDVGQPVRVPRPPQPAPPNIFNDEYLLGPIRQVEQNLEHNRQQQNILRQRIAQLHERRHDAERRLQERARPRREEGQALHDALGRFDFNSPGNP